MELVHDQDTHQGKLIDSIKKAAFVIGTALVCFVAARNTITWYLQQFWGSSGDFWQAQWELVYDNVFGGDEFAIGVFGTAFVVGIVYWFFNALLMIPDCLGWPRALLKYRVQEGVNEPVDPLRLRAAIKRVLLNQFIISLPMVCLTYVLMRLRGSSFGRELPTFHWVVVEIFIFIWLEEIGFYYTHRLLHHPRLYKHIHKIHHEWTAPIGIVSLYAHPIEHLLSNMLPPMLGPVVCGSHIATAWMWYSMALISTTIAHSGYHFPFLPSPEAHDFHHLKFNQCFGVLGVLDRLHGTDVNFRASVQYQRHFMLLSLVPMKEYMPDEKDRKALQNECSHTKKQ